MTLKECIQRAVCLTAWLGLSCGLAEAAPLDWSFPPPASAPAGSVVFTPEEREALFPVPAYEPDFTGVDRDRVHPAPAPGVHPRVYSTPEDLPEIRARIKSSKAAALAYQKLCDATDGFFHEGDTVAVDNPEVLDIRPEVGEQLDDFSLEEEDIHRFRKTSIQSLVDGSGTVDLLDNDEAGMDSRRIGLTVPLALNALRAWIDGDEKRGTRAAAAISHYAALCLERMEAGGSIGAYRPVHYLTLAYDYAAPFMTDDQRAVTRRAIAKALTDPYKYLDGAMYGVGHPRPSHNWVSLVTQYILMMALSIEGEDPGLPGIDTAYVDQAIEAMTETSERWIHYFWGSNGASFEGMGKNQLNASHYLALARRGNWLMCHPHVRRAIDSFYASILQPWGYAATMHSGWGGSHNRLRKGDVMPMKWLVPDDPVVDFVYRNTVGDDYERIGPFDVLFATDWNGPADWEQHAERAGVPVNYVDTGRAMLNARSAWEKDALWLQAMCDQQYTAHMQSEIGNFLISSHGRVWAAFIHANDSVGASSFHNVLLVDGVQQAGLGRMTAQRSGPAGCFARIDWAPAYNRYVKSPDEKPSINDYHVLDPIKAPYADLRTEFNWRNPWLRDPEKAWKADPVFPLEHAVRTVGLVRGPRPYVLIRDDVKPSGGGIHSYDWYMQVENDIVIASITVRQIKEFEFKDIVLASEKDVVGESFMGHRTIRKGAPVLLLRVLKSNQAKGRYSPVPGVLETYNNVPSWPNTDLRPVGKRLRLHAWADQGHFTVMLFPHRMGEGHPKTVWENKGQDLRVSWADQMDLFRFTDAGGGAFDFELTHEDLLNRDRSTLIFGREVDPVDEILSEGIDELF